ncbi:hypothetical protein LTR70_000958 [Exophiala xenobiotica]|uniref:Heterokaryon incompatibility domain-containing protein n=1 Tax=Lithohypha guttulata TaxID=1690604 RepID=A0ABR0JWX5_9EURO|nr:hypothetical protein LTR24_009482 [Lithohypha guttulata]KAK5329122.1 hypothetical protein LTR70_000958 [Exophiala xenobiotica]
MLSYRWMLLLARQLVEAIHPAAHPFARRSRAYWTSSRAGDRIRGFTVHMGILGGTFGLMFRFAELRGLLLDTDPNRHAKPPSTALTPVIGWDAEPSLHLRHEGYLNAATSYKSAWPPLTSPNHIRLFRVHRTKGGADIEIELSDHAMEHVPPYEAISYCWTTSQGNKTIKCNDTQLPITKSLYDALQARVRLGNVEYLWADTLCISQDDIQEKNSQISQSYTEESDGQFATHLRWLAFFELPYFERLWVVQEICNARSASFIYNGQSVPWEEISCIAAELRKRFDQSGLSGCRAAQHVQNVGQIDAFRAQLRNNTDNDQFNIGGLETIGKNESTKKRPDILDLIINTSHFKTGDARDRVFALVGLAGDISDSDWELLPNYGVSAEEVYRRLALWALARKGDMRLLSLSISTLQDSSTLNTSWIPNLSSPNRASTPALFAVTDDSRLPDTRYAGLCNRTPHQCYADGVLRPLCLDNHYMDKWFSGGGQKIVGKAVFFANYNKFLELRGAIIDEVADLSDISPLGRTTSELGLISLLGVERRRWPKELAHRLCETLEEELHRTTVWLEQCADLAESIKGAPLDGGIMPLSGMHIEPFWQTLTCNRLLNGYWAQGNKDGLLRHPGIIRPKAQRDIIAELRLCLGTKLPAIELSPAHSERLYKSLISGQLTLGEEQHFLEKLFPPETWVFARFILPSMARWSRGRRFGITSKHRYAAVPGNAQPGDVVCVFLGATVPYVLRPWATAPFH